jgi:capsular exopolysaccharide synthesis family protein
MSRIQQILAKAERDGTARRIGALEEPPMREAPAAPYASPAVVEPIGTTEVAALGVERGATAAARDEAPLDDRSAPKAVPSRRSGGPARVPVEATPSPVLVAALEPLSPAAEQYRSLRSRIGRAESTQPLRVIQITSPGKHDGKTVTALNLALTMAQEFQQRVLVIDSDLRSPSVHELLGLPPGPGLVDVLTGEATLEDALIEIAGHHLSVLRAGCPYDRPAEMLGSAPMRRLVDTLRSQFDRIVIDSAPATVADPAAVATLADTLVLVVRAGTTTRPAIARAIQALGAAKLLGLVFNASGTFQHTAYAASA